MRIDFFKEIPELGEAVKRESDARDAAFLDLTTNICGIEIAPMTPEDLLILDGLDNPLVQGDLPSPGELAQFLWRLSPSGPSRSPWRWFKLLMFRREVQFCRRLRRLSYIHVVKAAQNYVTVTFQDSLGSSSGTDQQRPYAGWCAHLINHVAREYGWAEKQILRTPLRRLFQYQKCIIRWHNPDAPMHSPSDRLIGKYIADYNRKMTEYTADLNKPFGRN